MHSSEHSLCFLPRASERKKLDGSCSWNILESKVNKSVLGRAQLSSVLPCTQEVVHSCFSATGFKPSANIGRCLSYIFLDRERLMFCEENVEFCLQKSDY